MNRILVVDDETSIRITLKAFLEREGWLVDVAPDATVAIRMARERDYGVVLTDVVMPRMSGIELLGRLRDRDPNIQVIVMTGEPTVETAVDSVKQGASDYLLKPIDKDSLILTVRKALSTRERQEEREEQAEESRQYQAKLEQLVQDKTSELQAAMQSIVLLLSSVVEMRDPYTAGHQRRVGNLSAAIAERLGRPVETVNQVRIIGYLHDIGKMVVPAEILTKPGRLNEFEMGIIRTHSQQGFSMLHRSKLPDNISNVIHQHHERLNGTGYPRGLRGNEILDEACIITVADVVEAMMSHRPYRPALGLDSALAEIIQNRGIFYRPDVVDACVSLFTEDHYVLDDESHQIQFSV